MSINEHSINEHISQRTHLLNDEPTASRAAARMSAAKIGNISIARTDKEMSTAGTDCGGDSPRTDVMLKDLVALAHRVLAH
jgi:hypothetical protein